MRFSAIHVWVPITTVLYIYDATDELLGAELEDDGTEELELATELELGMNEELLGATLEDNGTEEFELGITEELLGTTSLAEETTAELETTDELLAGGGDIDSLSGEQEKSNEA